MPRKKKEPEPSAPQALALFRMNEYRSPLIRLPGGFWTVKRMKAEKVPGVGFVPLWHVGVSTVRAMEKRGWLRRLNEYPQEWRDTRAITVEGGLFLQALLRGVWFPKPKKVRGLVSDDAYIELATATRKVKILEEKTRIPSASFPGFHDTGVRVYLEWPGRPDPILEEVTPGGVPLKLLHLVRKLE